jgi:hypothetical protein
VSVFAVFDQTAVTFDYYQDLYDGYFFKPAVSKALGCEGEVVPMNILILDRIEIHPPFRGRRFGLAALKCLIQRLRIGAGLIAMKPFPLQFESGAIDCTPEELALRGLNGFKGGETWCTTKLRRYYGLLGFKQGPRTPYMAMTTIYRIEDVELDRLRA